MPGKLSPAVRSMETGAVVDADERIREIEREKQGDKLTLLL